MAWSSLDLGRGLRFLNSMFSAPSSSRDPGHPPGRLLVPWAEVACAWILRVASLVAIVLGLGTAAIWLQPALALGQDIFPMRMNAALALAVAGISLMLWNRASPGT